MQFSEFIHQFAERFGIEAPEIVDDAAAFDADGMPFFLMLAAKEGDIEYLVVAADLGEPPPQRLEKLYQKLLDASHNFSVAGGGVLARNPGDGHIWLQSREPFALLDIETAISKVKKLGDAAISWRYIIRDFREGASIPESATAGEASAEPLDDASGGKGLAGFMLV